METQKPRLVSSDCLKISLRSRMFSAFVKPSEDSSPAGYRCHPAAHSMSEVDKMRKMGKKAPEAYCHASWRTIKFARLYDLYSLDLFHALSSLYSFGLPSSA